jgi:hypothetical protein
MTQNIETLPADWQAHGRHRVPANLIGSGVRRAAGVHYLVTTASPTTTAATIAQIAIATASGGADVRLPPRKV